MLTAPRIVRKSTWVAPTMTRRRIVTAAIASRIATAVNVMPSRRSDGIALGDDRRRDGGDCDQGCQAHSPWAHVGAGERDDRGQPRDRDRRDAAGPALGGQRHHHDERDQDQDQDNAVSVGDPLSELEPGLTAGRAQHPVGGRALRAHRAPVVIRARRAPLLLAARGHPGDEHADRGDPHAGGQPALPHVIGHRGSARPRGTNALLLRLPPAYGRRRSRKGAHRESSALPRAQRLRCSFCSTTLTLASA